MNHNDWCSMLETATPIQSDLMTDDRRPRDDEELPKVLCPDPFYALQGHCGSGEFAASNTLHDKMADVPGVMNPPCEEKLTAFLHTQVGYRPSL